MNANQARGSRKDGLGNRAMSLGTVIKEQRNERAAHAEQEVEYELGNGQESDEDGSPEGAQRVVMMFDEDGNAVPMRMGKFYYDSVQPEDSDEGEEEEEEEEHSKDKRTEQDTVRAHVPAPFETKDDFSDSGSSNEDERALGRKESEIEGTYVADADDYEYEDEGEDSIDDRFKNQFMRIQVPAAKLKDVSRVKKDVDHDKPHRKKSLLVGLQRAVSSVKISEGSRPRPSAANAPPSAKQATSSRPSAAKLGRLMSFSKERKQGSQAETGTSQKTESEHSHGLERAREASSAKPAKRQSLAAVGRMMSMTKSKGQANSVEQTLDTGKEPLVGDKSRNDRRDSASSEISKAAPGNPGRRAGLAQMGRMLSMSRKRPAAESSKPADLRPSSDAQKDSPASSCSEQRETRVQTSLDRDRCENKAARPAPGQMRMSLAKMGRMMSLSRSKKQTLPQQAPTQERVRESEKSITTDETRNLHISPVSSSTVSSKPVDSPASEPRDRRSGEVGRSRPSMASNNAKKEATRMTLRNAGRLLSFSRKPQQASKTAGAAPSHASSSVQESEGVSSRGRTLLVKDEGSSSTRERSKRTQSVPPKSSERTVSAAGGTAGSKLDGRASKFIYTEIKSHKVRMSGVLGAETHIRVPVIAMAEYSGPVSRTKWYIDGFTLPHNAVRRECIDLYEIISVMARFHGDDDITRDDMTDFEDWWKVATNFFHCYFEMERTTLFPWVDAAGTQDFEVQMALKKMRSMKDKLQDLLIKVDQVWAEKTLKSAGELYGLMYKACDELVPRLMNYFADQEVLLPAIVRGYYKLEDRLRMDKDMVNDFMGGPLTRKSKDEPHHNIVLLIRWVSNPRQLRAWIGKNLNSSARSLYPEWYALYQEKHYRFVRILKNRSKALLLS